MLRYVGLLFVALLLACDGETPSVGLDASTDRGVDAPLAADAPPTRCSSDRECSASGRVCNTATARCVECNAMADCGAGRACLGNRCITPVSCATSRQCPGQVCNTTLGYCVDCNGDVDCTGGTVCRTNACVAPPRMCRSSRECSDIGQVCDSTRSQCVDCVADGDCPSGSRCGAGGLCAPALPAGDAGGDTGPADATTDASPADVAADSGAVDTMADVTPADAMADASPTDAATDVPGMTCVPGSAVCPAGSGTRMVCNGDGRSTRTEFCTTPANASMPRCGTDNACIFTCNTGFGDCDGMASNGCETPLTSTTNCGRCGNACGASQICSSGACTTPSETTRYTMGSGLSVHFIDACAMPGASRYLVEQASASARVPLPFAFRYWSTDLAPGSMLNITTNGWIGMDGVADAQTDGVIPSARVPRPLIAPYWSRNQGGEQCVVTLGTAPNRQWVHEWLHSRECCGLAAPGDFTYEVILNEGTNYIDFAYQRMDRAAARAFGIQRDGTVGINLCGRFVTCVPSAGAAYRFVPIP